MSKRAKSTDQPAEPRPTFTLGDKTFAVVSTFKRNSAESYDEACEFDATLTPLLAKVYSVISGSGDYNFGSDLDITAFLNDFDIATLIRDFSQDVPKLVLFVAHGSDPTATLDDIKRLAGGARNPELYRAIFLQLQADGLFSKFAELSQKFGHLSGMSDPGALLEAIKKVHADESTGPA